MRLFIPHFTMAGLDPATQQASVCERKYASARAGVWALDGRRLKGGHGELE
jgi:hypothetical protein